MNNQEAKKVATPSAAPAGANEIKRPPTGPLATIVTRNEFYRDGFRNLVKIAIVQMIVIIGLILTLLVYMNTSKPADRYFATTADGRIMNLVPLDQPNMNPAALLSWVARAASEVMTFEFNGYQRQLQQSSRYFTKEGWESFTDALQKSRIIDSVTAQKQVVTAVPRSAPIVKQQGATNGKYQWVIQMPLKVTYASSTQSRADNLYLTLLVERVPSLENPDGVGIAQWIAAQK